MTQPHNAPRSPLLIHEPPLQVLPSLAVAIGLNEAIILQQVHYWLKHSQHVVDGTPWVYNSYSQWQEQFPFFSAITIKRTIINMERIGVLQSTAKLNRSKMDKTKWYTINYECLNNLCQPPRAEKPSRAYQNDPMDGSLVGGSVIHPSYQNDPMERINMIPLPETTQETNKDPSIISPPKKKQNISEDATNLLGYFNLVHGSRYSNASQIQTMLNAGATVEDCKLVIDWLYHVDRLENPQGYAKYCDTITPFRPQNFDRDREKARRWQTEKTAQPRLRTKVVL